VNSDIRLHCTFKGHRKRLRLRAQLGDRATDYLIDLWLTAAEERPLGILTGWDESDIALAAGYSEDPAKFVEALVEAKLLEKNGDGIYHLHDWEDHQPWAVHSPERSVIARQAARIRWASTKDAERMPDACKQQCSEHAPSPSPSPLLTLDNRERLEKEGRLKNKGGCKGGAPSSLSAPTTVSQTDDAARTQRVLRKYTKGKFGHLVKK
jgi:hypothetical protein